MLFAFAFSFFYLIIAAYINITWIHEIAAYFNYPFAIFLVVFIALIPGFIYVFTLISILVNKRTREKSVNKDYDVTVLIPVYNAEDSIKKH